MTFPLRATRVVRAAASALLCAAGLLTSAPASAALDSLLLSTSGWVVQGVLLSPPTVATLALNPITWQALFDVAGPYMSPYAGVARALALNPVQHLHPTPAPPQAISQPLSTNYSLVVSFGDSMSDTGNLYEISQRLGKVGLPTAPNERGRFSNGPVVLEYMSNVLQLPLLNYAVGGALSGTRNLIPGFAVQIGALRQIDDFLANQPSSTTPVDARALYVIWTGPDDFYADGNIFDKNTVTTVTANIKTGMSRLYARGARQFFVPLMPDLSITPSAADKNKLLPTYQLNAKQRSSELAASVTAMLKAFARQYPQAQVRSFDTFTYSQERSRQAAAEGYNVSTPCYTPKVMGLPGAVCADPDKYLFWDTNHPTAAAALVIGRAMAEGAISAPYSSR